MIAQALKDKTMELRKSKDTLAIFMVAVQSRAKDLAKVDDPVKAEINDDHALRAINGFVKTAEENVELYRGASSTSEVIRERYDRALAERDILRSLLPAQATADEVENTVTSYVAMAAASGETDPKRLMGAIMKHLKEKYGASLNSKEASGIVNKVING